MPHSTDVSIMFRTMKTSSRAWYWLLKAYWGAPNASKACSPSFCRHLLQHLAQRGQDCNRPKILDSFGSDAFLEQRRKIFCPRINNTGCCTLIQQTSTRNSSNVLPDFIVEITKHPTRKSIFGTSPTCRPRPTRLLAESYIYAK
jgi:hypothetical protein